jgi:FdhD protein
MSDVHQRFVQRWNGMSFSLNQDRLAGESVVHLLLNGMHVTTLLATATDLADLWRGHMVTEHDTRAPSASRLPEVTEASGAYSVNLDMHIERIPKPRTDVVTTSCGACNLDGLPELVALEHHVPEPLEPIDLNNLASAMEKMRGMQTVFSQTGGVHAAGIWYANGELVIREDIGRHNAVDKVIGHHLTRTAQSTPLALLLSGRCGWDIVAKAARMNLSVVASIGAASHLAADVARKTNMTLVTFLQNDGATIIGPVEGRFRGKD